MHTTVKIGEYVKNSRMTTVKPKKEAKMKIAYVYAVQ